MNILCDARSQKASEGEIMALGNFTENSLKLFILFVFIVELSVLNTDLSRTGTVVSKEEECPTFNTIRSWHSRGIDFGPLFSAYKN